MQEEDRMSKSVDEIIQDAMMRGEFNDLKNKGKPLKLDDYFETPDDARLAYSILKNADILPEELQLLKEIEELEQKINHQVDDADQKHLRAKIAARRLKYNLLMDRFKPRRS